MNKIFRKTIAVGLMVVITLVIVITATYAWMVYSAAPEVQGIQLSLGGSSTILLAPNVTQVVDGKTYHYPGKFSQMLNFNQYEQYSYLNTIDCLSPVSTADGQHWFLPTYYGANDDAVLNGMASAGQLRPYRDFYLDTTLEYANLTGADSTQMGNYICLDFWVVSPNTDYYLRVAQGDENSGSYVIDLMDPINDPNGGYSLVDIMGSVAASARVGFLVNSEPVLDDTMMYYAESGNCPSAYTSLRGNYQETGDNIRPFSENKFVIYEPNGDFHPQGVNGIYSETKPIAWVNGEASLADIRDNLCVQLTNKWYDGTVDRYYIEEVFKAATMGKHYFSTEQVKADFYQQYLQGNVSGYVDKGDFITYTSDLYNSMVDGVVTSDYMNDIERSGATEDVTLVHLEKNVPQRIRMFIWVEGQDLDCMRSLNEISFALGLELAGSKIDE